MNAALGLASDEAATLLVTPEEAARQLQIARCRVYGLIKTGELRSKKIGASRRIPYDALVEYIKSLPDEPAST